MKKPIILFLIISSAFFNKALAQQIPVHSQYMFNSFLSNPAICGTTEEIQLKINGRYHMLGFGQNTYNYNVLGVDPSPKTYSLSYYQSVSDRSSFGAVFMYDQILPIQTINFQPTYAHRSRISSNLFMSLAIGIPFYLTSFNNSQVQWDQSDQLLDWELNSVNQIEDDLSFSANFGLYLYNDRFDFGFSVKNIWESEISDIPNVLTGDATVDDLTNNNIRHYFIHSSYDFQFDWASSWAIVPSILLKSTEVTQTQIDLNLKLIYMDFIWIGSSYRKNEDVITAMCGINLQNFFFGYSYDISTSPLASNYSVAHGLTIGFYLKSKNDYKNVRNRNRFFEDRFGPLYWYPKWL